MKPLITCCKCGWVHFEVSRKGAELEVHNFNEYFNTLSKEQQDNFYGGKASNIANYEHCMLCGNTYKEFRDAKPDDCPDGCTLNPIISRRE